MLLIKKICAKEMLWKACFFSMRDFFLKLFPSVVMLLVRVKQCVLLLLLSFCGGVEGKKICWKKIAFSWNRFGSHSVEHIICTSYIKNWVTPPWFFIFKNQLTMYTTFVISISKKREEKDFSKPFWDLQCTTWWINHVQIKVNCRFAVKLNWG